MIEFSPTGIGNKNMALATERKVEGKAMAFVLTVPFLHWSSAIASNSPRGVPDDVADAYKWFPSWQLFWDIQADAFAGFAAEQFDKLPDGQQVTGVTPSPIWVTQYAAWFCKIRRLAHPAKVASRNTYARVLNACQAGKAGAYQIAV